MAMHHFRHLCLPGESTVLGSVPKLPTQCMRRSRCLRMGFTEVTMLSRELVGNAKEGVGLQTYPSKGIKHQSLN